MMRLVWKTPKPSKSFIPKVRKEVSQHTIDLATMVFIGAVDRTPTASGELRASWNLSQGSPNFATVGSPTSSPGNTGAVIPKPVPPKFTPSLFGNKYFITNGKSYAGHVEFGSPTISPALMLTRAVQAIDF